MVPQIGLNIQTDVCPAGDKHGPEVGHTSRSPARPRVVLLESGVKALIEVVGLADIDSPVDAILVSAEKIDACSLYISGSDRVDVEGILAPGGAIPDKS